MTDENRLHLADFDGDVLYVRRFGGDDGMVRAEVLPQNRSGIPAVLLEREQVAKLVDFLTRALEADDLETVDTTPAPERPAPEADTITAEAEGMVYGDRQDDYAHPRENLTRTAVLWQGLLLHKLADGEHVTPEDVARCMIGVKLARDAHHGKRDNRVDMAGYALVLDRLETGR